MNNNFKNEVETWLKNNVHWEKTEISSIPTTILKSHLLNIAHSINNFNEKYIYTNLSIYSILKDELSYIYFSESLGGFIPEFDKKNSELLFILVFQDGKFNYVGTNSDRLFLQISVDIGVSDNDKKLKSEKYLEYKNNKKILEQYYN